MKISDELEQLLKNLHLKRILEIYEEQLPAAEKEDVSYSERVVERPELKDERRRPIFLLIAVQKDLG